jgi:hypothetical protein
MTTIDEAVCALVRERIFNNNPRVEEYQIWDYLDRLPHTEFLVYISKAFEKVERDRAGKIQ